MVIHIYFHYWESEEYRENPYVQNFVHILVPDFYNVTAVFNYTMKVKEISKLIYQKKKKISRRNLEHEHLKNAQLIDIFDLAIETCNKDYNGHCIISLFSS